MNNIKSVFTLLFLFVITGINSQFEYLNIAQLYFKNKGDYAKAKEYIDTAMMYKEVQALPHAHLLMAQIYHQYYNQYKDSLFADVDLRMKAINAYRQYILMADPKKEEKTIEQVKITAGSLSRSFYNSASILLEKYQNPALSIELFTAFETTINLFEPNFPIKSYKYDFTMALAQFYHQKYDSLPPDKKDPELFEKAVNAYTYAIELDTSNYTAYYNLGVLYYNEASKIADKLHEYDLEEQFLQQVNLTTYVLKAEPFLRKAYSLNPSNPTILVDVVRGLATIYTYLQKTEEAEYFNLKLIELKKRFPSER